MSLGAVTGLLASIVGLAMVVAFLGSPNTASIIKNIFDGFSGSISAALGK